MLIFLIGYMGSGKSKTAEALAKVFNYRHYDTDQLVVEKTGRSIDSIFKTEGQEYFREIEKEVLYKTELLKNCVISTGGGTACFNDNMDWMNKHGTTVYLEANAGLLFHRLATSKEGRPLISGLNDVELMEQIIGQLAVRIPIYRKAKLIVGAADMNVKQLAEKIKNLKSTD